MRWNSIPALLLLCSVLVAVAQDAPQPVTFTAAPSDEVSVGVVSGSSALSDSPIVYIGNVDPDQIVSICGALGEATGSFNADVSSTSADSEPVQVIELDGCAGSTAAGVQANVSFNDQYYAVICDEEGSVCYTYVTGVPAAQVAAQVASTPQVTQNKEASGPPSPPSSEGGGSSDNQDYQDTDSSSDLGLRRLRQSAPSTKTSSNGAGATGCSGCTADCQCVGSVGDLNVLPFNIGCFPGSATVQVEGKGTQLMKDIHSGDRVLSVGATGQTVYDLITFFGHRDGQSWSEFVQLQVLADDNTTQIMHLTKDHFVPVLVHASDAVVPASFDYQYAKDVHVGALVSVLGASGTSAQMGTVMSTHTVMDQGLFNPFTKGGLIVVDGVVASVHSYWALDSLLPSSWSSKVPALSTKLFLPIAWAAETFGAQRLSNFMDSLVVPPIHALAYMTSSK